MFSGEKVKTVKICLSPYTIPNYFKIKDVTLQSALRKTLNMIQT